MDMNQCGQCGLIHPPIDGDCPMAKAEKRGSTEKGKTINNFLEKITEDLEKSDNYLFKIESINKTLSVLK